MSVPIRHRQLAGLPIGRHRIPAAFERRIPCETIKTITISILASACWQARRRVAAQDEDAAAAVTTFTGVFCPDGEPLPVEPTSVVRRVASPKAHQVSHGRIAWSRPTHASRETTASSPTGSSTLPASIPGAGEEANFLLSTIHELTNDGAAGSARAWPSAVPSSTSAPARSSPSSVGMGTRGSTAYMLLDARPNPPR